MKMKVLQNFILFFAILNIIPSGKSDCQMSLTYHLNYGYGYEIKCNRTNNEELRQTFANSEISLTIINSNLTLDKGTFRSLRKIRILHIEGSHVEFSNDTFSEMKNLQKLILANLNLVIPHPKFLNGLFNLKLLNLTSNAISSMDNATFQGLTSLKTLILNNNHISRLEDVPVCNLSLQKLYLSNNKIDNVNSTIIKSCYRVVEELDLSSNHIKVFKGVISDSLNKINLSNNSIEQIGTLELPNLNHLDLSFNKLTSIKNIGKVPSLIELNLRNNSLKLVDLSSQKTIKNLDLSANNLTDTFTINMSSLVSLNLAHNNLSNLHINNASNLEKLDLSYNNIKVLPKKYFVNWTNIQEINLSNNQLNVFNLTFKNKSSLSKFNISHNHIGKVETFENLEELLELDLSNNKIRYLNDSTFKSLENLEILNMSNNLLEQLDYKLVEPLENLQILDVDANMLKEIDYSSIVSELPKLDAFKAKNNLLTCEFLTKMIRYFKDFEINFALNEHLDIDKENVAGVYCKETENKLNALKETEEAVQNNTKVLNELYTMYHEKEKVYQLSAGQIISLVIGITLLVVVVTLVVQRFVIWRKRKNYLIDELEMIHNEPYKRLS